jgi:SET domain-containing protein
MVLNQKVEVRESATAGHGLYAKAPISAGEVVWQAEEDESKYHVTIDVINTWPEDVKKTFMNFAYQLSPGVYAGVPPGVKSDDSEYMNHSCEPTTWFVNDKVMLATRDIAVDEEVTYDYGTSESEASWHTPFTCNCRTKGCRGSVTGNDWKSPVLREKYQGHFTEMVQGLQKEFDAAASS